MPKPFIIAFNGPPGSGKDFLAAKLGLPLVRFSQPLKHAAAACFGATVDAAGYNKILEDNKDNTDYFFQGMTYRQLQIWLSESVFKPKFGVGVFGAIAAETITSRELNQVVIPDCGFLPELQELEYRTPKHKIFVFSLFRDGKTFVGDSRAYLDPRAVPAGVEHHILTNNVPGGEEALATITGLVHRGTR